MNNDHILSREILLQDLALCKAELEVALDLLYAGNNETNQVVNRDIKKAIEAGSTVPEIDAGTLNAEANESFEQNSTEQETEVSGIIEKIKELESAYLGQLPKVPLSRCPFTGRIVYKTIDTAGLDGPWWDYNRPVRLSDSLPDTFLGFSGSMRLENTSVNTPFTAMVGPSTPCVIPELLSQSNIRAVLSTIKIGRQTGIIVSWFAEKNRCEVNPPNEWGAPWCEAFESDGSTIQIESPFQLYDFDTELAGWIRNGKLLWIAPGDSSLLLRADIERCPYLDSKGDGRLQYIIDGQIQYLGMMDDDIQQETMSDEEFSAALKMLKDEDEGF